MKLLSHLNITNIDIMLQEWFICYKLNVLKKKKKKISYDIIYAT